MTPRSIVAAGVASAGALALLVFGQRTQTAQALPTFAQAYGVDCSTCHTSIPALNAYGRYVQSTAFAALDPATMKKSIPVVLREASTYRSTGRLNSKAAQRKFTLNNTSVNLVGVLSKDVSYRFEQSLFSNDLGGGTTGHFWAAYNHLFNGDGHLIVGKIVPPVQPALSAWGDMTGFSAGSIGAGQHSYGISSTRWGVAFNYVPQDYAKHPFKVETAYLGNGNVMYNDYTFSSGNPYQPGAAGSDKEFAYKAAYARPDKPLEAGVYGSVGSYVLLPGYVTPIDRYHTTGVYAQRDAQRGFPAVLVWYQRTYDSNIGTGRAAQNLTQPYASYAYALEIDQPLLNGNVILAVRPVEYDNGLIRSASGYSTLNTAKPHFGAFDIILRDPKISPYLYAQIEAAVAAASNNPTGGPTWRAAIRWASPVGPRRK